MLGRLFVESVPVQEFTEARQAAPPKLIALLPGREGLHRHFEPPGQPGLIFSDLLQPPAQVVPKCRRSVVCRHMHAPSYRLRSTQTIRVNPRKNNVDIRRRVANSRADREELVDRMRRVRMAFTSIGSA